MVVPLVAASANAATPPIELVSQSLAGQQTGSWGPAASEAADRVAFVSSARLVAEDTNDHADVYFRDRQTARTVLVSVNTNGIAGNGASFNASITADGRWVVFESRASDLAVGDSNGTVDVFARDLAEDGTILLSRSPITGNAGNGSSYDAQVSRQGDRVVFTSRAEDLVPIDANGLADVFAASLADGSPALVSVSADGSGSGLPATPAIGSREARIDVTGTRVTFRSSATNLTAPPVSVNSGLFQRDLLSGTTQLLLYRVLLGSSPVGDRDQSAEGRWHAAFLSIGGLQWIDAETGTPLPVPATTLCEPGISGNGRFVCYGVREVSAALDEMNLEVWSAADGLTVLASLAPDGVTPATGFHRSPQLNHDGSRLTWLSNSTNLVEAPVNGRLQLYQRDLVNGVTSLLSASPEGAPADGEVSEFVTSPDGRWVAFVSDAGNLDPAEEEGRYEVFLRDLDAGTVELISVPGTSSPRAEMAVVQAMNRQCLSADGNLVLFATTVPLVGETDTNCTWDVYLRNLAEGTVQLVSARFDGMAAGVSARDAVLSANGRIATFASEATNVLEGVATAGLQLYWRNLATWEAGLVTVQTNAQPYFGFSSATPVTVSGDGRLIGFASWMRPWPVVPGSPPYEAWVFDLDARRLQRIEYPDGKVVQASQVAPTLDGTAILLTHGDASLRMPWGEPVPQHLKGLVSGFLRPELPLIADTGEAFLTRDYRGTNWFHDVAQGRSVELDAPPMAISGDGRFVALLRDGQVCVWNSDTGDEVLASLSHDGSGPANGFSNYPVLTRDGRYVIFESLASDLVANDDNGRKDVFARDLLTGATWCLSQRHDGEGAGDHGSFQPIVGPDGFTILFRSAATDLTAESLPLGDKWFVVRLGTGDADGDGLDDEWETIWFDGLERDGTADFDGDTMTDRAEFRAGTSPRDGLSVLRVSVLHDVLTGARTFRWQAIPGRAYVLQGPGDIASGEWVNLGTPFTATGTEVSVADPAPNASHRFYRVKCVTP